MEDTLNVSSLLKHMHPSKRCCSVQTVIPSTVKFQNTINHTKNDNYNVYITLTLNVRLTLLHS